MFHFVVAAITLKHLKWLTTISLKAFVATHIFPFLSFKSAVLLCTLPNIQGHLWYNRCSNLSIPCRFLFQLFCAHSPCLLRHFILSVCATVIVGIAAAALCQAVVAQRFLVVVIRI
jgi:hypothetical protein